MYFIQSITRRAPPPTSEMVEATVDARRKGLRSSGYYAPNKSTFTRPADDLTRKDCKSFFFNLCLSIYMIIIVLAEFK